MRLNDQPITNKKAVELLTPAYGKWADQMMTILKSQTEVEVVVEGGILTGKD